MLTIIVFAPLILSLIAWFFADTIKSIGVQSLTIIGVGISMFLSCLTFIPASEQYLGIIPLKIELFMWIPLDNYDAYWTLRFDPLVKIMFFVVTTIAFLVHVYSIGYMTHDQSKSRFMMLISLFTFFMLLLVASDNFIQLFCGWEGVGLCSYLLIGFWHHKDASNSAAMKAFIVNRIGDLGLVIAMAVIYYHFGSFDFDTIFGQLPTLDNITFPIGLTLLDYITLFLFIGAMGKSAQFGLHVWLPDAMEGPTPVSALIHAATMVTAGVFLMVRCSCMLEYAPFTKNIILVIGTLTAFFAATVALVQTDIKRIIAYSTCSQLGYMFMAIGSGFYTGAIFHLYTHAFFKALLFLAAGSVIHAFSDEQNIEKMGNVWRKIPLTYSVMWLGSLALIGFPFFSGFYSKDAILHTLSQNNSLIGSVAYITGLFVALLTSFYIFRLIFLVFHGNMKANDKVVAHIHESPYSMLAPLVILSLFAIGIGMISEDLFLGASLDFWKTSHVILPAHPLHVHLDWLALFPLLGFGLSYIIYIYGLPVNHFLKQKFAHIYTFFFRKWLIDELYTKLIIQPTLSLSKFFWKIGDEKIIEGSGPKFITTIIHHLGNKARLFQTGYISDYVLTMFSFLILFILLSLLWVFYGGVINVR